jgi:hypothetical protein
MLQMILQCRLASFNKLKSRIDDLPPVIALANRANPQDSAL